MSKSASWVVWVVAVAGLGCFFLWPIGEILRNAFLDADGHFTARFLLEVLLNPIYLEGLLNSFGLALASTALSLGIALPLSLAADRLDFPGKKILAAWILLPMVLPPFVGAIGVRQILGQFGALNALLTSLGVLGPGALFDWMGKERFWGVAVLNALHLYPVFFLNLSAALSRLDPAMDEAAENLGCSGARKFFRITLPLMAPGLFAGGTVVFISAFTELGVPLMFDYGRVTPVQIFHGLKEVAGNPFPFALVVVMLGATAVLYGLSRCFFGAAPEAGARPAMHARTARSTSRGLGWGATLAFAGVSLVAVLPHLGVVAMSLAGRWYDTVWPESWTLIHYETALAHSLTVPSILRSLQYASLSTLLDVGLGGAIAYVLVRANPPLRNGLDFLVMLPLAVPGLVLAFGYLAMTQAGRAFEAWNPANDPTWLLVVAYAVRRLPYVVRSVAAGLQQSSVTLEEAAQNLGATPVRAFWRITAPLIAAHVLAGGVLAFSFAMLEVSDSLVLAQKQEHYPITKAIYELFQLLGEGRSVASALGVWAMVFLALSLLFTHRLMGRKLGALLRL